MEMKKNNLENKNDDVCEVFDSHDDVVERVKERIPDENEFAELSEFFKIFGNPTRLKIISLLSIEDLCVCDICEALDLNQTTGTTFCWTHLTHFCQTTGTTLKQP